MRVQNCSAVMRLLVLGGAIAIAMATSVGVKAADLAYPPPIVGPPQYGEVAPPAVVPPQVIVVPGPTAIPQYSGAPLPPPVVGPSYAVPSPVAAGVGIAPRRPCAPDSRCGVCGWQAGCTPLPSALRVARPTGLPRSPNSVACRALFQSVRAASVPRSKWSLYL